MGNRATVPSQGADWKTIAYAKQANREGKLAERPDWRVSNPENLLDVSTLAISKLTPRERDIVVNYDATELASRLQKREFSAVEVLTAFSKVAVAACDLTNCLSEIFIDEGLAHAAELDAHLLKTGEVVGPFHGVPVSIKDHILLTGLDTSTGYSAWAYKTVAERDALVVSILRQAGAVFYVKTQNPQTLLSLETNNNIYGRTVNPFNTTLTSGGSSGGEAALIALHGSPLGVGTDIGGSIRIPAAHCGLYGLKGSVGRLPHGGLMGSHDGMDNIVGCVGPLAHSARDLSLFASVMLAAEPWLVEPPLFEIPWKEDVVKGNTLPDKLSIAILSDDGVVAPHPPIADVLAKYKDKLIAAGHDVIEWEPLEHQEGWDLIVKLYLLDGGEEYRETMKESGEPAVQQSEWILSHATDRKPYSVSEIFKLNAQREAFRAKALAHWNATALRTRSGRPVDVILSPIAATCAPPHDTTCWWGYSSHWNILDLPAAVFPVGRVSSADYAQTKITRTPRNDIERFIQEQWSAETYAGAPVSLQVVGRRLTEERLLALMEVIEDAGQ